MSMLKRQESVTEQITQEKQQTEEDMRQKLQQIEDKTQNILAEKAEAEVRYEQRIPVEFSVNFIFRMGRKNMDYKEYGGVSSLLLGVLNVPRFGILLYHWSVYLPR